MAPKQETDASVIPMRTAITPGSVIPARSFSPEWLLQDWRSQFSSSALPAASPYLRPSESDFVDIEWNAQEAIRRCQRLSWIPASIRAWIVPMDPANACLIYALKKLTEAWHQSLHPEGLPSLRDADLNALVPIGVSAGHWYQQAKGKFDALTEDPHLLQQFSLRQWRFHLFASRCLDDLKAIVEGLRQSAPGLIGEEPATHLYWHTDQLHRHFAGGRKPTYRERFRIPRFEINRLAATACIYHVSLLRSPREAH